MNKQNDYTIIIPCYKGLEFLPNIFRQIHLQTLHPYEIIFINDGDEKINENILNKINKKIIPLVYIKNTINIGVTKSIKKASSYIKTKYLKIMSVDDLFEKDYAKTHIDLLNAHPYAGMSFSNPAFFYFEEKKYYSYDINLSSTKKYINSIDFIKIAKNKTFKIFSNTPIYNTLIFRENNYFDDFYGKDADQLTNFIISAKYGVCFVPEIQTYWGMHSNQISRYLFKNYNTKKIIENIFDNNIENYIILKQINFFYDTSFLELLKILFSRHIYLLNFNFIFKFIKFKIWKISRKFIPKIILAYIVKNFS